MILIIVTQTRYWVNISQERNKRIKIITGWENMHIE